MHRRISPSESFARYTIEGNKTCIFFVHGLNGDNDGYWGKMKDDLLYDERMRDVDFAFYGYQSTLALSLPRFTEISRSTKVPSVDDIVLSLISYVQAAVADERYCRISIFGHSLGGLVALLAAVKIVRAGFPLRSVCVNATPLRPPLLAQIGSWLLGRLRPHLNALSKSQPKSGGSIYKSVQALSDEGVYVRYMHCIGDYLVKIYGEAPFSRRCRVRRSAQLDALCGLEGSDLPVRG